MTGKVTTVASPLALVCLFRTETQFFGLLVHCQACICHSCQLPEYIYIQLAQISGRQSDPIVCCSPSPTQRHTIQVHERFQFSECRDSPLTEFIYVTNDKLQRLKTYFGSLMVSPSSTIYHHLSFEHLGCYSSASYSDVQDRTRG